jgi:hypothetical protein
MQMEKPEKLTSLYLIEIIMGWQLRITFYKI